MLRLLMVHVLQSIIVPGYDIALLQIDFENCLLRTFFNSRLANIEIIVFNNGSILRLNTRYVVLNEG